jgi:hypothetical protein
MLTVKNRDTSRTRISEAVSNPISRFHDRHRGSRDRGAIAQRRSVRACCP